MDALHAESLENLLQKFDHLGIGRQVGFERLHLYSIVTHSTAIEGSTVTFEENAVMFDNGILPAGRHVAEQMRWPLQRPIFRFRCFGLSLPW